MVYRAKQVHEVARHHDRVLECHHPIHSRSEKHLGNSQDARSSFPNFFRCLGEDVLLRDCRGASESNQQFAGLKLTLPSQQLAAEPNTGVQQILGR